MATITVNFKQVVIIDMAIGSDDPNNDYLVSHVCFDMKLRDISYDTFVEVRQPRGTDYLTEPFEVRLPANAPYRGPFPLQSFSDALDLYYRSCLGEAGVCRVGPDTKEVTLSNCSFAARLTRWNFNCRILTGAGC